MSKKTTTPQSSETPGRDAEDDNKLSSREAAFIERYLIHRNGARAAREAGYSEKTARVQASKLLTKANISSRVRERFAELQMEASEVHERLSGHARVDMTDFLAVKLEIPPLWSPEAKYKRRDEVSWGNSCFRAIADNRGMDPDDDLEEGIYWERYEPRKFVDLDLAAAIEAGKGHLIHKAGYNKHGQLEIELVDSQSALVNIGRIHKMFTDKVEHDLDAEATAAVASLDSKLDKLAEDLAKAAQQETKQ